MILMQDKLNELKLGAPCGLGKPIKTMSVRYCSHHIKPIPGWILRARWLVQDWIRVENEQRTGWVIRTGSGARCVMLYLVHPKLTCTTPTCWVTTDLSSYQLVPFSCDFGQDTNAWGSIVECCPDRFYSKPKSNWYRLVSFAGIHCNKICTLYRYSSDWIMYCSMLTWLETFFPKAGFIFMERVSDVKTEGTFEKLAFFSNICDWPKKRKICTVRTVKFGTCQVR